MVYILLAPGFEETEALAPADLLRRAGLETELAALQGEKVTGSHGITVEADTTLDKIDLSRAEMLVLPGGGVGVKNLGEEPRVEALVQEAVRRDIWVAAICAAPTLLGRWGYLAEKQAVCYPGMEGELACARARMDQGVVTDGKVITARAAGSAVDFGLALVSALAGEERAAEVRRGIYY